MSVTDPIDSSDLDGLDPYDLLDQEAARIDAYLSTLTSRVGGAAELERPSRCAGWSVGDVVRHLAGDEVYFRACLDDEVGELFAAAAAKGATDVHSFNAIEVEARAGQSIDNVLAEWRAANAETRRRMRERDGGDVATSVGPYPVRLQAFHIASELATHADDMFVPVPVEQTEQRRSWRVRFSRFALKETKPDIDLASRGDATEVTVGGRTVLLDPDTFIEAVAGRLGTDAPLEPDVRHALSTMP
jgi:uncharacterized protein (TIGR03083 family)